MRYVATAIELSQYRIGVLLLNRPTCIEKCLEFAFDSRTLCWIWRSGFKSRWRGRIFPVNGAAILHIGLNLTKGRQNCNPAEFNGRKWLTCGVWRPWLEGSGNFGGSVEGQMHINFSRGLSRFLQYCIPVVGKSRG